MSRKEYADLFGVSTPTAARDLKDLTKKGIVEAKGPLGPGRWYELTKNE
jgi:predicted HTH transcriptional regulator